MSDQPPHKHRVIDWNPSAHQSTKANANPGRTRLLGAVAIVALLVAVGAVAFSWRTLNSAQAPTDPAAAQVSAQEQTYVARGRAELALENASQALAGLRKLPVDHPNLLQEIALIEKAYIAAETQLKNGHYAVAAAAFEAVDAQMEAFTETVTMQQNANTRYDSLYSRLRQAERIKAFDVAAYDRAFNAIGEGRRLLTDGLFRAAWQSFDDATVTLDDFEQRKNAYVDENLRQGQVALNRGDRDGALTAFQAALAYDNNNEAGLRGVKRAATIAEVHALLETARTAEEASDFDTAISAYEKAFALDALSVVAQQGAARAKADREQARFASFVAAAESAAAAADWDTVIARYQDALGVYPNRDDIKTALANARDEHHAARVFNTLAEAYDLEREYKWDEARIAYERLLTLEPDHQDAIDGLIRVGRTVRAKLEYEKLVQLAQQLVDAADYQAAIRRFNEAMQSKPGYLEVSPEVAELRSVLENNSRPVNITFLSDTRTWVSISNFRMLGRISEETVALPPGDYEVVGRRKDYQDVLLVLKVRPGMTTNRVSVVCNVRADT